MLFMGYLLLGAFAGMLAGLFGIGGGLIIVPVLVLSFHAQGVAPDIITHLALGTSLPTMIFTGFSSLRAHQEAGAVDWVMIRRLGAGMLVGAWLGGMTANLLSASTLNIIIGCFAWTMALQMGLNLKPKAGVICRGARHRHRRHRHRLDVGLVRHRWRLADRALSELEQRADAQRRGSLRRLQHAHRPGGQPQLPLRRLEQSRPARVEPGVHLPAGAARHRAHQYPVCPGGGQAGAPALSPAAQAGIRPADAAGGHKFMLFS